MGEFYISWSLVVGRWSLGRAYRLSPISLSARCTEQLTLNRPIVSANIDTITRAAIAVVVAEEGGIGIIDRVAARVVLAVGRAGRVWRGRSVRLQPDLLGSA